MNTMSKIRQKDIIYPILGILIFYAACTQGFVGAAAAILAFFVTLLFERGSFRTNRLSQAMIGLVLLTALCAFLPNGSPPEYRIEQVVRYLGMALASLFIAQLSYANIIVIFRLIAFSILPTMPFFIAFSEFSIRDSGGSIRFASILHHANHLGYVCAVGMGALFSSMRGFNVALNLASIAILFVSLALSKSSGGTLVAILILALWLSRQGPIALRVFIVVFVIALTVFVLPQFQFFQNIMNKVEVVDYDHVTIGAQRGNFGGTGSSFGWRVTYWTAIVQACADSGMFRFLFGQGLGSATEGNYAFSFMYLDPHNDFLRLILEYGIAGLAIIIILFSRVIASSRQRLVCGVFIFGPMIAGNSIISFSTWFVIMLGVKSLGDRRDTLVEDQPEPQNQPFPIEARS